ncbi:MAG: hypothetical protein HMLIMOIP_002213 [Candidatus Nitrosomirales archaeon]
MLTVQGAGKYFLKSNKNIVFGAIVVSIILVTYHGWFMPGVLFGHDFQIRPQEYFTDFANPHLWSSSLYGGTYTLGFALVQAPVFVLTGILSYFVPYELLQRIVWLYPFLIISFGSSYYLIRQFTKNVYALHLSILFFAVNPIIIDRLSAGHVWFAIAYALMPLVVGLFNEILKSKKWLHVILFSTCFSIAIWFEVRVALLSIIPVATLLVLRLNKDPEDRVSTIKKLTIVPLVLLLLNCYWIIPTLLYPSQLYDDELVGSSSLRGTSQYAGNLIHSFQLYPKDWDNFYTYAPLIIPVLGFSILFTEYRRKIGVLVFSLVALALVFLGKGSYSPFAELYAWLIQNIPLAIGYRNANKFWLVLALIYAVSWSISLTRILTRLQGRTYMPKIIIGIILTCLIVSNSFLIGGYTNDFGTNDGLEGWQSYPGRQNMFNPETDENLKAIANSWEFIQANSSKYSRTLWLPSIHNYRFASEDNPLLYSTLFNNNDLPYSRIFVSDPNKLVVPDDLQLDLPKLLAIARVEHVILLPSEAENWYISRTSYAETKAMLDSSGEMENIYDNDIRLPLDENQFSATNGQIEYKDGYIEFLSSNQDSTLTYNLPSDSLSQFSYFAITIRENKGEWIELHFMDKDRNSFVHIVKDTPTDWKTISINIDKASQEINWNNLEKLEIRGIFGGNRLQINNIELVNGGLQIYKIAKSVPLIYAAPTIISSSNETRDIIESVKTLDINQFAVINEGALSSGFDNLALARYNENPSVGVKLTWTKLEPTKYSVQVNSINPIFLVFSETYSKYWVASIEKERLPQDYHFLSNGYANGYYIPRTGSYTIDLAFEPQEVFVDGLIISLISLNTFAILIIYLSRKQISDWTKRVVSIVAMHGKSHSMMARDVMQERSGIADMPQRTKSISKRLTFSELRTDILRGTNRLAHYNLFDLRILMVITVIIVASHFLRLSEFQVFIAFLVIIPISWYLKSDGRIPVFISLVLLLFAVLLWNVSKLASEEVTIYSFWLLLAGIAILIVEYAHRKHTVNLPTVR